MKPKDYPALHDVVFDAIGKSLSNQELDEVYEQLPHHIKMEGFRWGWGDTVFRDMVYRHLKK